jgi:hypothetical protein
MTDDGEENRRRFVEMAESWREDEMQWMRFTADPERRTLWLEVWKVRPTIEPAFDPPYTGEL